MGSIEQDFIEDLQKLAKKSGINVNFEGVWDDLVILKSVSTESALENPFGRRVMLELMFFQRLGQREPHRRRGYDYESTAEEIIEIDGPKKELPRG